MKEIEPIVKASQALREATLATWVLFTLAGIVACEQTPDKKPTAATSVTTAAQAPASASAAPAKASTCATSKDCAAAEVCVHAIGPDGTVGSFACAKQVLSGNGQGVACQSDADCTDSRLAQIDDIKAFVSQGLHCSKHGQTSAKICTTAAPEPAASGSADAGTSPRVECRAKTGADVVEIAVDWGTGGGVGKGTLKTTKAGKTEARAVKVTMYKGILLIDAPDEKNPGVHLGQVQEIDGKKTIQVGGDKAPRVPCE
jgi:hypothetical protein